MEPKRAAQPPSSTTITRTSSGNTGTVIQGKYQLGRLLGRGSFAKVYYGISLSDNASVAIKVIDKPSTVDPSMEQRIIREISAMRCLNPHPNILKLHEVMATKTKIYLVMELAHGGELLAKLSRRGRLTEQAARVYFQQLVSTLRFCHENGIAHRDVKPQNLLLDIHGNLKVSDFGLSALPEQLRNGMLHTACGTPAYAAPEVVRRRGYDGPKADAWSCGVILFVFLAGYLPFDDRNLPNMYQKIHHREFQFPDWISKPARNIIYRLLDPNPNTRMSIEALMSLAWFRKSLPSQSQSQRNSFSFDFKSIKIETRMTAFDIISMSSGLDLSGLFEATANLKQRRFTSMASVEVVEERVGRAGVKLGYRVKREKGWGITLVKGRTVLLATILAVTPELLLAELRVVDGVVVFDEAQWEELRAELEDIVLSWHDAVSGRGERDQQRLDFNGGEVV